MGEHEHSDRRQDSPGVAEHRYARGRSFWYQVAMAICLLLIGWCVAAMWWGSGPFGSSGLSLLVVAVFPGLFPAGFLCLVLYGYWLDYRSEQAKGIVPPRFQFNIRHLLWLVLASAILCSLVVFALRSLLAE